MRKCFVPKKFSEEKQALIVTAATIIEEYRLQGLKLTLRQLYYQFVAHHGLPNTERSYKTLGKLISDARLAGYLDWDAIEDRGRQPDVQNEWPSIAALCDAACDQFRLPRWQGQRNYVELWVEKQALAGVLEPVAEDHHVTLMVNKGYSSQSAMFESAKRFIRHGRDAEENVLFYLGDHDPSGEDMVRDVRDRLELFGVRRLRVIKIALTMPQVEEYSPPPNPAKMTDSRAPKYVEEHGYESWEVDALDPDTLVKLITETFDEYLDRELMQAVIVREEEQKAELRELLESKEWEQE